MLAFLQQLSLDAVIVRQSRTALVLHETPWPRTEAGLVAPILLSCSLDDVAHAQHGPVGHSDFPLQLSERRLAILAVCWTLVAEGMRRADPRAQRHPQTLK